MPKKPTKPKFPNSTLEYKDGSMRKISIWYFKHFDGEYYASTSGFHLQHSIGDCPKKIKEGTLIIHEKVI